MDELLQLLSGVATVLDYPGALLRGVLSGRPGERASGRDMLESWGVLGPNQEGFDAGDVAGFGADLVADPLNLLMGTGVLRNLLAGRKITALNEAEKAAAQMRNLNMDRYTADVAENAAREARMASRVKYPEPANVGNIETEFQRTLRHAPSDDAAEVLAKRHSSQIQPGDEFTRKWDNATGRRHYWYRYPEGVHDSEAAYIMSERPDIVMMNQNVRPEDYVPFAAHENIHGLDFEYPEIAAKLRSSLGPETLRESYAKYMGVPVESVKPKLGTIGSREGLAQAVESVHPVMYEGAEGVNDLTKRIMGAYSLPEGQARDAAQIIVDEMTGLNRRRHALVPVGPLDPSYDRGVEFSKILRPAQGYAPLPEPHSIPSTWPLLAALGGYNAARLPGEF